MHFILRAIALVVFLSFTTVVAKGQELKPDPVRDEALGESLQSFATGNATVGELEAPLRQFAKQFEAQPYKMRWARPDRPYVDMMAIPEGQLKSMMIVIVRLTAPIEKEYFNGHSSASETAKKWRHFFDLSWVRNRSSTGR